MRDGATPHPPRRTHRLSRRLRRGEGRRAPALCALLVLVFFATAASAERYGDLFIEPRPVLGPPRMSTYYEYRFGITNASARSHVVAFELESRSGPNMPATRVTRTFTIAPRSGSTVTIPFFVVSPLVPRDAVVTIDGDKQDARIAVLHASSSSAFDRNRDILVGRTVSAFHSSALVPDYSVGSAIRADLPPAEWSTSWLQYLRFDGMLLTARDWAELPPAVQTEILRWLAAGGTLTFFGAPENFPATRPTELTAGVPAAYYGFGVVFTLPEEQEAIEEPLVRAMREHWSRGVRTTEFAFTIEPREPDTMQLVGKNTLPVGPLFMLLVAFAIVGGPLNVFFLAKKNKRLWIFWTLPLLAVATAVVLVGAVMFREGWLKIEKTSALTLLDETRGEAATIGITGFYTTVAPKNVQFDATTDVRPLHGITSETHTDWTEGQRLVSGWIGSRVPRTFAIRRSEPRRERLPIRREGNHLLALNGLGADIDRLWVADEHGVIHRITNLPAGKEAVLVRTSDQVKPDARDPATLFGQPRTWSTYPGRVGSDPHSILGRNMYIAVLKRSPFTAQALPDTNATSEAVVVGLMKRSGDAS
jgi:hypothetical protein